MVSSSTARIFALTAAAVVCVGADWPDLSSSGPLGPSRPDDAALIVALSDYHELPTIPHAVGDASLFGEWLTTGGGLRRSRVVQLYDPSCDTLRRSLRTFARLGVDGGRLWLHIVGHGGLDEGDSPAILCVEHDPESGVRATLPLSELAASLRSGSSSEAVVVLDASLSGHTAEGVALPGQSTRAVSLPSLPGVTLFAAAVDGPAPTLESPVHSALTWLVVGGLRGWADAGPKDAEITPTELHAWLRSAYAQQALPVRLGASLDPTHRHTPLSRRATEREPDLPDPPSPITPLDRMNDAWRAGRGSIVAQAYAHADADWLRAATRGRSGRESGRTALLTFLARYQTLTYPFDEGEIAVVVPQVAEAQHRLRTWGEPWKVWVPTVTLPAGPHELDGGTVTLDAPIAYAVYEASLALRSEIGGARTDPGTSDPALGLSWTDAVRACDALSKAQGLRPAVRFQGRTPTLDPTSPGWRLPSADEWRAAAGQHALAPRFDRPVTACATANLRDAGSHPEDDDAWQCHDGFTDAAPVGALPANERGLHELVGNAAEWVWDANDRGERLLVGGSYRTRPSTREPRALRPDERPTDAGFRCVRTLSAPEDAP